MKVTALWVYPIKALRGIPLQDARLGPQGLQHDRNFMLCRVKDDGSLEKLQLAGYPQCALFDQEIIHDADTGDASIRVRYHVPKTPIVSRRAEQDSALEVPLQPDIDSLDRAEVNVHQSLVRAYRMGDKYDEWFSACLGFDTILLYIGDQRRPILGTFSPKELQRQQHAKAQAQKGWLSSITSYVTGDDTPNQNSEDDWLTFSDCAPFLLASDASLTNVRKRLESGDVDMVKFRPNIVLDGESQWDEDFWASLSLNGRPTFVLSKLCGRCASVNVDYDTGKPAEGERGDVLKKLMSDRRVDSGHKYNPVFGRYAFLTEDVAQEQIQDGAEGVPIAIGDDVGVVSKNEERPVWDWPMKDPKAARFYAQAA